MPSSANRKAIPWLLAWSSIYALTVAYAKDLDPSIDNSMIVFFRALFGFLFLVPALVQSGFISTLVPKKPTLMLIRSGLMMLAMWATYRAYRSLDLSIATSIGFTQSIITTTFAGWFLSEKVSMKRWIVVGVGYCGVLFFTDFSANIDFQLNILVALGANVAASLAIIVTKKLTQVEQTITIIAFPLLVIILFTGILNTINGWHVPSLSSLLQISLIAGGFTYTQYAYVRALQHCEASFAAPFEYLKLIIAVPIGYFYFHEILAMNKIIGSVIILASNLYLLRNNNKS
jgi:drug/metabolite transporter (DMT)-like permease